MDSFMNAAAVQRLEGGFQQIGEVFGEESRRGSFALYAMGLLGEGERRSVEPIAARACPDPEQVDAMHPHLLHFAVRPTSPPRLPSKPSPNWRCE
nr:transposase [Corallococcus macrosporus]